ncbi:hypothetical protein Rhow_008493 [Rhodococcus wratislaviensis]|uniref:Uncharacterized protein n=1 Tax=Rhodococcus wratislaviensis TaxID=44752 RepID=A0A402CKX2_RHOWR|nr:hypothetical protein Rhow_008493 [Rhodococcus wratislaviensis]
MHSQGFGRRPLEHFPSTNADLTNRGLGSYRYHIKFRGCQSKRVKIDTEKHLILAMVAVTSAFFETPAVAEESDDLVLSTVT